MQDYIPKNFKSLSEKEAQERLKKDGFNELPSLKKRNFFHIIFEIFKEPMFILLLSCGFMYFILGDITEALMLLGFVFVIMGITVYQEGKTERALHALRDLSSPRAMVIRDGVQKRIAGREVVKGDIIIVKEGDRIPADAVLLWGLSVSVDESLLTGESIAVRKRVYESKEIPQLQRPGGDDLPFLYSASLVVHGQGIAQVLATGINTEIGKIGKSLSIIEDEKTLLQKETAKVVKTIFFIAVILCISLVILYGFTKGSWLNGILAGLTLAMSILPEEFPVVLTVFLAIGAWRISKKNVLTRRVAAVETLGSATILCVDKTGTITQNKMSIKKIFNTKEFFDPKENLNQLLPESFHELIEYAILASKKDPFDPMEKALKELGYKTLYDTEHLHDAWPLIEEYPLSKEMLALVHVWQTSNKKKIVSAKGAPESIADLCHFSKEKIKELEENISFMAQQGLRVLGVAKAKFEEKESLPDSKHDFEFEFLGLIGLEDPIRETVPLAIKECYNANIRVVMITGDYPLTAQNIARQIGLKNSDDVLVGPELNTMSHEQLQSRIKTVNIFSRVLPEQKLLLVDAFKAQGQIVAMTGDGVNDAPALKSAHIGIAMGQRGTDVAREASDLVLLDDDFSSIVKAVRMGRRIYDNLKKAIAYVISVHIPIAGISLVSVICGWPIILYPVHIVFLELIIDPACSIVFEAEQEEENIMNRPPHPPGTSLFDKRLLILSSLQGLFCLGIVVMVLHSSLKLGQSQLQARTLAFTTLIISNFCLIITNRSWSKNIFSSLLVPNKALWLVLLGTIGFLALVIYVPFLQKLFHLSFMHTHDIFIALFASMISIVWFEIIKFIFRKKRIQLLKA